MADPMMLPDPEWGVTAVVEAFMDAVGSEQLTVPANGNSVGFAKRPTNARIAIVSVEGANIRMTEDGDAVSASIGLLILSGSTFQLYTERTLQAVQFASATGVAATLNVIYYLLRTPTLEAILTNYPSLP